MIDAARIHLHDLPPDIRFAVLPRTEAAFIYSFDVKRAAMRPYIEARWGWDAALQRRIATLRAAGEIVIVDLPGHEKARAELGFNRMLRLRNGKWVVEKQQSEAS